MSQIQASEPERRFLLCAIGAEWYGFDLAQIAGVVSMEDITPVPGAPEHIVGVQNLQGRLLAVLDTAAYLGLADSSEGKHVVILRQGGSDLGCLVHRAEDIVVISEQEVQEPLSTLQNGHHVISAQVHLSERLVGLLNIEALIAEIMVP